jgi:hypothetical protein
MNDDKLFGMTSIEGTVVGPMGTSSVDFYSSFHNKTNTLLPGDKANE